jgi:hypothetical protein
MGNSNTLHSKKLRGNNANDWNKNKKKVLPITYYDDDLEFIEKFKSEAKAKKISYIKLFKEKCS